MFVVWMYFLRLVASATYWAAKATEIIHYATLSNCMYDLLCRLLSDSQDIGIFIDQEFLSGAESCPEEFLADDPWEGGNVVINDARRTHIPNDDPRWEWNWVTCRGCGRRVRFPHSAEFCSAKCERRELDSIVRQWGDAW